MALTKMEKTLRMVDSVDDISTFIDEFLNDSELEKMAALLMAHAHTLRHWQREMVGTPEYNVIERQTNAAAVMLTNACDHLMRVQPMMDEFVCGHFSITR